MYYSIQKFNFYSTGARLQTHHLRKITPVCLALIKLAPQPTQQNKCSRVSANHRHVVYVCVFMCIFFMSFDSLFQFASQLQSDFVLLWTCRVYSQHDKKEKIQQVMGSLLKYFLRHLLIQVSVLYILCKYITFVNARFLGQRCLSSFCLSSSICSSPDTGEPFYLWCSRLECRVSVAWFQVPPSCMVLQTCNTCCEL